MGAALPHAPSDQLNLNLERCKRRLERKFEDPRNIEQIAETASAFMQKCFCDINLNQQQLLKYSLLSEYMLKVSLEEQRNSWSENWLAGFQQLTQPEHLATVPRLADNFLSPSHVFNMMEEVAAEFVPETPTLTGEDTPNFLEHRQSMLRLLLPMFTVISDLPDSWSQKVFITTTESAAKRKEKLSMQVGGVAWNIETAVDGRLVSHRAAFMGSQSKSVAIKYLATYGREGQDNNIHKKHEKRQIPWDSIKLLRASGLSNPLDIVELIDVPGADKSTLAGIALKMSSTLVLCTGNKQQLYKELKVGELRCVPDVVKTLNCSIPIICLVTETVALEDFFLEKRAYSQLLQLWFPNNEITVHYANFHHIQDSQDKEAVIGKFFEAVLSHPSLVMNPFKVFGSLRKDLELFTQGLSNVVKSSYFELIDTDLKKIKEEVENLMFVEKQLWKNSIAFNLMLVHVKQAPVFSMSLARSDAEQEKDVVYFHQALRNDLRIAVRKWAETVSKAVLKDVINQTFHSCDLLKSLLESSSQSITSTLLKCIEHLQQISSDETGSNDYLTLCRPLGTLVSEEGFQWVLIGHCMIESDEFITTQLFKGVGSDVGSSETGFGNWRSEQFSNLNVPYQDWVSCVNGAKTGDGMSKSLSEQMDKAARKYVEIMRTSKLLKRLNKPLEQLVKQSFIMLHRLLVHFDHEEKGGRLQFTGLVNQLREKTKDNPTWNFATCAGDKSPAERLKDCQRSHEALMKIRSTANYSAMSTDLDEMKDICEPLESDFNHNGKSIICIVQVSSKSKLLNQILREASSLMSKFNFQKVVGDGKESCALTKQVRRVTCAEGAHVVVWFRRDDSFSTDPDDSQGETAMLMQLNRNPYIVVLYIIMGTEMSKEDIDAIDVKMWNKYAPTLDIHVVGKEQFRDDLRIHISRIEEVATSGQAKAEKKIQRILEEFDQLHRRFQSNCRNMLEQQQDISTLNPEKMSKCFEKHGIFHESLVRGLTDPIGIDLKWSWPDTEYLKNFFKETHATNAKESEARAYILHVLLGQTIAEAQRLAGSVFDRTIAPMMVQLANMCLWNVEDLMENIQEYINLEKEEHEDNEEVVTHGFVVRKHFMDMYVGVVLSIAMPLLRATVLPTILTKREGISAESYRKAVNRAKQELSSECVAHLAHVERPPTFCF